MLYKYILKFFMNNNWNYYFLFVNNSYTVIMQRVLVCLHGWGGNKGVHFDNLKTQFIYKHLLEKPIPEGLLR